MKSDTELQGNLLNVEVTDLSRGGAGVARDPSGRILFIPMSVPGDQLTVKITEVDRRYAQAEIVEVLKASAHRTSPKCPIFGECGGCQWQHIPYGIQWETKRKGALHALERAGVRDLTAISFAEFPASNPWNYRNRVQLRGERDQLGFFRRSSKELVAAQKCDIAREEINAAWAEVRSEGSQLPRPYKVEVEVLEDFTVRKTWNSRHAASGFRQVNDAQNEKLKEWIGAQIQKLAEGKSLPPLLLDLFGGSGNLSLGLASLFGEIHCVDVGVPAKRPENTPEHFIFHKWDVEKYAARLKSSGFRIPAENLGSSFAILDPPREGLGSSFQTIADGLERVGCSGLIAVGCDPDAWARDVSRWIKRGYILKEIALFDFFPQTPHVESVARLELG